MIDAGRWRWRNLPWGGAAMFVAAFAWAQSAPHAQVVRGTVDTTGKSGAQLYVEACAACHGRDGKGKDASVLGFDVPTPDFTDCQFAPREANADWVTVAHEGGPVRGFSSHMPAFGGALGEADLASIISHIKTFCASPEWPRGELNLPKALHTEKAYPEDEWVMTTAFGRGPFSVESAFVYEKRFGPRNQIEIKLPFAASRNEGWEGGAGDLAVGFKRALAHSLDRGYIVSMSGEASLPTGDSAAGLSKDTTVFETFVTFGKLLSTDSFFQFQGAWNCRSIPGRPAARHSGGPRWGERSPSTGPSVAPGRRWWKCWRPANSKAARASNGTLSRKCK